MAGLRRISYLWKDADAAREYSTGVSLHSHTNQSKETLDFLATFGNDYALVRKLLAYGSRSFECKIDRTCADWSSTMSNASIDGKHIARFELDCSIVQVDEKATLQC